jgi:orotate phosphoribosyltransferase
MTLEDHKKRFIELMVEASVLSFGDFTGKSGRKMPYFINAGLFRTGSHLERLGGFYADTVERAFGDRFDVLFGPAYKGIPLAAATAMALSRRGHDVGFSFNRKEVKDHGEGGSLVGQELRAGTRVVIIEDVTTAGTSIRETVPLLKAAAPVDLVGLVVAVDRQERGQTERSALAEVGSDFGLKTASIVTVDEIVAYLREQEVGGRWLIPDDVYARIVDYRRAYGGRA